MVEVIEETYYPFSKRIALRIRSESTVHFSLHLRLPGWCDNAKLEINGRRGAAVNNPVESHTEESGLPVLYLPVIRASAQHYFHVPPEAGGTAGEVLGDKRIGFPGMLG